MEIRPVQDLPGVDRIAPTVCSHVSRVRMEGDSSLSGFGRTRSPFAVIADWAWAVWDWVIGLFVEDKSIDLVERVLESATATGKEIGKNPSPYFATIIEGMIKSPVATAETLRDAAKKWDDCIETALLKETCCEFTGASRGSNKSPQQIVLDRGKDLAISNFKNSPEACRKFLIAFSKAIAKQFNTTSCESEHRETVAKLTKFFSDQLPMAIAKRGDSHVAALSKWINTIIERMEAGKPKITYKDIETFLQDVAGMYYVPVEKKDIFTALDFSVYWEGKSTTLDFLEMASDTWKEFILEGGVAFAKKILATVKDKKKLDYLIATKFLELCKSSRQVYNLFNATSSAVKVYGEEPQEKSEDLYP